MRSGSCCPGSEWLIPQRGTAHRWLELADHNARHLLESLRIESFETEERAEDPVYALGRDLGLSVGAPQPRLHRHLSQPGHATRSARWCGSRPVAPARASTASSRSRGSASRTTSPRSRKCSPATSPADGTRQLPLPDLIVIDGGKGQLNAALRGRGQRSGFADIPIVSLAKREEEVFLPGRPDSLRLSRRSPSLRLLQRARDEAHRFGLAYNRKRRTQRTITSELLNIPGVGPRSGDCLLERFGSLAGVRSAAASELATVPGFSTRLAERILDRLDAPS